MSALTPETQLWDAMRGVLVTRALAIVTDLHAADVLARRPMPVNDLAAEVGSDPDVLRRLLRPLASDGIFAEESPRVFRNTDASELLQEEKGWGDYAHLAGGIWLGPLGALDASGTVAFPRVHGTDYWSWLAANPDERAAFDRAMQQRADAWRGDETSRRRRRGQRLPPARLARAPSRDAGNRFDLPEVVRDQSSFGGRCKFVAGSFFERSPADAGGIRRGARRRRRDRGTGPAVTGAD